ncbi:MAG: urea carboxylase [Candidatus Thiodiazotropha sp. 'RUGA']|nr:urea carboxylase [Candidatus Thiodiazotropha sp. 'RUGA']
MFSKVLIANRGAIATRIIRTLQRLDIPSLAVYAESDADSLHVRHADQAFSLGDGVAANTYLDMQKIIAIAKANGVDAIHPGYGFLSENADFVRRCEAQGIVFIGPTPEQMELFGLKHKARELAQQADVPLTPGTELLQDLHSALTSAERIGYPVMLKSTAGGGGIGMQLCHASEEVTTAFDSVKRLGANNFANDGVFIEKFIARARHIEVQVFGDGKGGALAIGERDCSSQRRNQKVVEECPAPNLTDEIRQKLYRTAESLLSSVCYRNAGTVEFIYDADTDAFYFLEVNTRLQVEHGVTEEVYGIDLVEWMIKQAAGDGIDLQSERDLLSAKGHAVQVRLYAEDPYRDFQPSPGLLSEVLFPDDQDVRIDRWIESGVEVPAYFDPMLAKVIVHASERSAAFAKLHSTLAAIRLYGSETNLDYLSVLSRDPVLLSGEVTTRYLNDFVYTPSRIDVLQGGTQTTIQDYPARAGYWDVGVPPSGPFDNYSFQLANRLLGNPAGVAGMEITMQGPSLKFSTDCQIALAGAEIEADLDGEPLTMWSVVEIHAGQTLSLGRIRQQGARSYLAVSGGIDCPDYLGSKSTFTLGQFGGHNGRALRTGDVLRIATSDKLAGQQTVAENARPQITNDWQLRVIYGPQGAPDFFTQADIERFFSHQWEVHYNSSRTGIRLIGPKPEWARKDGGEAGLHPSNIHDNAYAFGSVDFTGDMPVILGPDGPSLGGFVCPATVIQADLWKLGQLRAGDKVSFVPVDLETAVRLERNQIEAVAQMKPLADQYQPCEITTPVVGRLESNEYGVEVVYRLAGDHFMLVEYGEQVLDISLRFRAHALMQWLQQHPLNGLLELTPGIRSLQIHFDAQRLTHRKLLQHLQTAEHALASQIDQLHVPSRIVHIPLSWDDEACHKAIEKYDQSVRKNAPWCPSNLEFIRRINGLQSIDDVKQIVFDASYLVMGLGDVYLGAPVATPVDPRHRLVTTKYNPARTWTAENSVGIGGSYLCVYGMEGPGGYQFVGRTLQMWNRYKQTAAFEKPWLLRFFDQIRFYEVSQDELATIRKDFPQGRYPIKIEESQFSLTEYQAFIHSQQDQIEAFRKQRQQAFEDELAQWHADGQFNFEVNEQTEEQTEQSWPEASLVIDSPISGSVWQTEVEVGQQVKAGECLMILESMKMEIPVYASADSRVTHLLLENGQRVGAGQALVVLQEA